MMNDCMHIHKSDNVAVLISDKRIGETIHADGREIALLQDTARGHKIAIIDIAQGDDVIKYGHPIGKAVQPIRAGEHVHTHNLQTNLKGLSTYSYDGAKQVSKRNETGSVFRGYRRTTGMVGIRNELWVVPTVGCINGAAQKIVQRFNETYAIEGIDGVFAFPHAYGCSQLGQDHINTRTILADIIRHPNAGGVLVLGLGCENNGIEPLKAALGAYDTNRVRFCIAQEVEDEIETGVALLYELYQLAKGDVRTECPASALRIGLKCGGSDGLSGITANPLLGRISDRIVSCGGTAMLTEVAEMFGAETVLMQRAESREVFEQITAMINTNKEFYLSFHLPIYENPSPGNKAGGITTLEEKSLGCIQKSGSQNIGGVVQYGDVLKENGLFLIDCVANDSVSSTALGAAGCQMVLFTTGRGTPLGSFIPTVKVATNTDIYNKKRDWFDFNAGMLLDGCSASDAEEDLLRLILEIAGGKRTANEANGYREISIFKSGITL